MTTGNTSQERDNSRLLLIAVLAVVGAIWYFTGQILTWLGAPSEQGARGQFGDMYGAINTLFSGLAFAFLIANTYMQSRQLKMQQMELALTRQEISAQLDQMKEQSLIFDMQVNDSIFFKLLESIQIHSGKITFKSASGETSIGSDAMLGLSTLIMEKLSDLRKEKSTSTKRFRQDLIIAIVGSTDTREKIKTYVSMVQVLFEVALRDRNKYVPMLSALFTAEEKVVLLSGLYLGEKNDEIEKIAECGFFDAISKILSEFKSIIAAELLQSNNSTEAIN